MTLVKGAMIIVIAVSDNNDNKRNDIGMIVGVIVAVIVVAILVAISAVSLRWVPIHPMMTSSNGNIFRVTGPLCGKFTGHRWIPLTNASDA